MPLSRSSFSSLLTFATFATVATVATVAPALPAAPSSARADAPAAATPAPAPSTSSTQAMSPGVPGQPVSAASTSQAPPSPAPAATPPATPPGPGPAPYPDPAAYSAYDDPPFEAPTRTWYGWQTLIVMGASTLFISVPIATQNAALLGLPIAAFVFGGPIVHFAHGRVGRGFGVFGMHLGIATGGSLIGAGIGCAALSCSSGDLAGLSGVLGAMAGASFGLLVSNIIDISSLTYTDPREERRKAREQALQFTLVPQLSLSPEHTSLTLAGTF